MQRTISAIVALLTIVITLSTSVSYAGIPAFQTQARDTIPGKDSLRFPLTDRRGDAFTEPNRNTFDLQRPSSIKDSIAYDPVTKRYYIYEKIGNKYYRKPTSLTFDEYMRITSRKAENDY